MLIHLYHGWHGFGIIEAIFAAGLLIGCVRGIAQREGMYDRESTNIMYWSQILGIILSLALIIHVAWRYSRLFQGLLG